MRQAIFAGLATLGLGGWPLVAAAVDAAAVAKRMSGDFEVLGADGVVQQRAQQREIRSRALPGRVIFAQWQRLGADGEVVEITRQRLWSLHDEGGTVVMRFHTFRDHRPFVDLHEKPLVQAALGVDDLVDYPDGCALRLDDLGEAMSGVVRSEDCRLDPDRHQRDLAIDYSMALREDGFDFSEAAHAADGSLLYRMPEEGVLSFRRR